ncbi:MAG: hypothetical protein JNK79_18445 [Chitinophagaceae bacterium]|nr:hypothetical protein [Chitinophagaceae bacterium]
MRYHIPILFITVILIFASCKKKSDEQQKPNKPLNIRVAGYLYSDNYWNDHLHTDLSLLTDLNLAFVNPDENGQFLVNDDVIELVAAAHAKNVRVYASLGGGAAPAHISDLLEDENRSAFVGNLADLTDEFGFDGVDVDLEGDFIDENYADFISELSSALKAKDKLMTAALATWNGNTIHDTTLAKFDFINVMSYDQTGPWDPSNPGQHSPYEMALSDANYYIITRGINSEKILIGVPFYGYWFAAGTVEGLAYKDIVAQYPGAENKDMVETTGGGRIYYNGIPTIEKKVQLAADLNTAGIMIWEINQDASGDKSLLNAINKLR